MIRSFPRPRKTDAVAYCAYFITETEDMEVDLCKKVSKSERCVPKESDTEQKRARRNKRERHI